MKSLLPYVSPELVEGNSSTAARSMAVVCHLAFQAVVSTVVLVVDLAVLAEEEVLVVAGDLAVVAEVVLPQASELTLSNGLKVPNLVVARRENRVIEKLKGKVLGRGFQRSLVEIVVHKD